MLNLLVEKGLDEMSLVQDLVLRTPMLDIMDVMDVNYGLGREDQTNLFRC